MSLTPIYPPLCQARGSGQGCSTRRRTGFTLVELLVVVSVLALLIAILLPSLRKARQQSKRLVCQTNLRQIAFAWDEYLQVHNGTFLQGKNVRLNYGGRQGGGPPWGPDPDDPKEGEPVPKPLNPYLGLPLITWDDAEVFRCPSDRGSAFAGPTHFAHYGTSYQTNVMLIGQDQLYINPWADPCAELLWKINQRLSGINRSQIGNESKLILIGDHGWYDEWDRGISDRIEWHHRAHTHNIAFMDSHVEFVRIHKGVHVTPEYVVIPFVDLAREATECQECAEDAERRS